MDKPVEFLLRAPQMEVFDSDRRFRVLVAGRRFGKTHLAMVEMLRAAWGKDRRVWYVAPSYRQAKQIAWDRLKQVTRRWWGGPPLEVELTVRLKWGGTIALKGADQYDSLRGTGLDFVVLDEYASMRKECWTDVLRPALSDRKGKALFIGTPQGLGIQSRRCDPDVVLTHVSRTSIRARVSARDSDVSFYQVYAVNGHNYKVIESVLQDVSFCLAPTLPVCDNPKLSLSDDGDSLSLQSGCQAKSLIDLCPERLTADEVKQDIRVEDVAAAQRRISSRAASKSRSVSSPGHEPKNAATPPLGVCGRRSGL